MGSFFQHVFTLLTTETGSLTYHLVLAFSIALAFQGAYSLAVRRTGSAHVRRILLGLGLLFLAQLVLFGIAGLAWQGLLDAPRLLPPIDRAAILASLLVVVWLWAFPEPARMADAAAVLLGLLTLILITMGIVWWSDQGGALPFNGSWPDFVFGVMALVLILAGCLLLLARRPDGWGVGLSMLILLLLGHIAHLASPVPGGDYPGAVRLAQMAAFPLLLVLPQVASGLVTPSKGAPGLGAGETHQGSVGVLTLQSFINLFTASDPDEICQAITRSVAQSSHADLCLLVLPPDDAGEISIQCGYDSIHAEYFLSEALDAGLAPGLAAALQGVEPLNLPAGSEFADQRVLADLMGLEHTGPTLLVPVSLVDQFPLAGLILLSPYSNRPWSEQDQDDLIQVAAQLAKFLHQRQEIVRLHQAMEYTQSQVEKAQEERQNLLDQLEVLQQKLEQEHAQFEAMAMAVAGHQQAKETIQQLQAENENLRKMVRELPELHEGVESPNGELRMALEEVAMLRAALAETGQKVEAVSSVLPEDRFSQDQVAGVASIAQELRQPMASIIGYTDFLLGESIGILGAPQRRLLDRIRLQTERIGRLLDDLLAASSQQVGVLKIAPHPVDPTAVLDSAIQQARVFSAHKNIGLSVDVPDRLPPLKAEPEALHEVLVQLLQNAVSVTSQDGEVSVQARTQTGEGEQDYVVIQVTDGGGGIAASDLPRVFSHIYRDAKTGIPGVGETSLGMAMIKSMVEAQGGRIWVDSEPGLGARYSIVFPVPFEDGAGGEPE